MEKFSNKEFDYKFDSSINNSDNTSLSDENVYSSNHKISTEEMETVDLDEFSGSIENDPYNVVDSGFTFDEIKMAFNDVKSINTSDDEII